MWNFPINAPMSVRHVDGYTVGANINFAGDKGLLIAACGMCTFGVAEPVTTVNTASHTQALMMIMLRFVFAHTIILDKNSKFHDTFK